jgi:hypothetical protein
MRRQRCAGISIAWCARNESGNTGGDKSPGRTATSRPGLLCTESAPTTVNRSREYRDNCLRQFKPDARKVPTSVNDVARRRFVAAPPRGPPGCALSASARARRPAGAAGRAPGRAAGRAMWSARLPGGSSIRWPDGCDLKWCKCKLAVVMCHPIRATAPGNAFRALRRAAKRRNSAAGTRYRVSAMSALRRRPGPGTMPLGTTSHQDG